MACRVRVFSLLKCGLQQCKQNSSEQWNPLRQERQNLASVAIVNSVPFSVLRDILDAMKSVNGNIDDVHKNYLIHGPPLLFVANQADLVLIESVCSLSICS